jgi:thiamine pyrophosphokinase
LTVKEGVLVTKRALIIANGEPPKKQLFASLVREFSLILCADGGANTALKFGVTPHVIVGDMDSIHAEALVKFRNVLQIEDTDENSTDLEKVIRWAIGEKIDHLTVVAALGKRLDHTIGNLGVLPKFYPDAIIRIVDDVGELSYIGKETTFDAVPGTTISLIPLNRCDGITTIGLKYALNDETLELGVRDGTSNEVVSSPVTIRVRNGHLLLYRVHRYPH